MKTPLFDLSYSPPLVALMLMALASPVSRAGVAAPYAIGTWEGFRPAAISYTFDDDCPNQYVEAVPMFHTAGIKMTLFTVTSWEGAWSAIQQAAAWGDEIASHTVTHAQLTSVSSTQLTNELGTSQSTINSYVTNERCLTIAYPNCALPAEYVVANYYFAGRGCSGQVVPSTPSDFLNISSFILGNTGSYTTGTNINALADSAFRSGGWCVYLTHAIDGDSGYSPLSSAALQASVNYTSTNTAKFWVETFGNVVRYIKERNASSVAETSNTGSSITVQVSNTLDGTIYNYPISLRRPLPTNWPSMSVTQNGHPITTQFVTISSTNYAMFDVVPNGGNVVLTETVQPFSLSNPAWTSPASLTFQLNGQPNVTYTISSSADLMNWASNQACTLTGTSTNIIVNASSNSAQFYRAQWAP